METDKEVGIKKVVKLILNDAKFSQWEKWDRGR